MWGGSPGGVKGAPAAQMQVGGGPEAATHVATAHVLAVGTFLTAMTVVPQAGELLTGGPGGAASLPHANGAGVNSFYAGAP